MFAGLRVGELTRYGGATQWTLPSRRERSFHVRAALSESAAGGKADRARAHAAGSLARALSAVAVADFSRRRFACMALV
jgi:hypothetical protein